MTETGVRLEHVAVVDDGAHSAFPHVCATGQGELLAVWRRASGHREPDGSVWSARSADGAATWSTPTRVPTASQDARDPCVTTLADGRVAMSWFDFDGQRSTGVRVSFSSDAGASFPHTRHLPEPWGRWTAVSSAVVELDDGTLLLAVYGREGAGRSDAALLCSVDGGDSWSVRSRILAGDDVDDGLSEPWLVAGPAGLSCLIRTESHTVLRCRSTDAGRTWGAPERLFPCHSRATWLRTGAGTCLAVHRSTAQGRAAVVRVSHDDWRTWSQEVVVDAEGQNTYAGLVELAGGAVVVVWSMESPDGRRGRVVSGRLHPLVGAS